MRAKLIYREGYSYFGGKNPYDEDWHDIIEIEGKHYRIDRWGNYNGSGSSISEFELEEVPEEYERIVESNTVYGAGTKYSLMHGNGEEIDVSLTDFDLEYAGEKIPESLREEYKREYRELAKKRMAVQIENNPKLDYEKALESLEIDDEKKMIAQKIVNQIETELLNDRFLSLVDYAPIIENLREIAEGRAVIVTHTNSYYSQPDDRLYSTQEIASSKFLNFADSGSNHSYAWGTRDTKSDVYSLEGRKIELGDERTYVGSWKKEGYIIDMMLGEDGHPYIVRNIYENWANSQDWESVIDLNLPVERFEIETGEEGSLKEYNENVHRKKEERREFYKSVIGQAKQEFGLTEEQLQSVLEFAGTVSSLELAVSFARDGLSVEQATSILRKRSHEGVGKVLREAGILTYPNRRFDVIQDGALTLKHIRNMQREQRTQSRLDALKDQYFSMLEERNKAEGELEDLQPDIDDGER